MQFTTFFTKYLYKKLNEDENYDVITEPEISSVVFRYVDKSLSDEENDTLNKKIRRTLIHQCGTIIGQTVSDGKVYLKFTLLNPLITSDKLDELLALIKILAKM